MNYIDTHAHLNFPDYDKDRDSLIKKTLQKKVFIVNVGTDVKESERVVEIAEEHGEGVYASVGLHPLYLEKENFHYEKYKDFAKSKKVVAIGETGLDYKYIRGGEESQGERAKMAQKNLFQEHIELAKELDLPIIVHSRMAHQDTIEVLRRNNAKGVIHCFSGNKNDAKDYLEMGFYLGINGIIFKMNLEKVIKNIPMEKILLETDCPFLSPIKEEKRNEPLFIDHIAQEVARIKGVGIEDIVKITTSNAKNLFAL